MYKVSYLLALFATLASTVSAGHQINVQNNCGSGTPTMYGPSWESPFQNGPVNIGGGYYTWGDLNGFIIYLQTGQCGANGDNCLIVEGSLNGRFSSVDISRIPDHSFNAPIGFYYTNGAGGRECSSPNCACNQDAFCGSTDYGAQVGSSDPNASITVTFC